MSCMSIIMTRRWADVFEHARYGIQNDLTGHDVAITGYVDDLLMFMGRNNSYSASRDN